MHIPPAAFLAVNPDGAARRHRAGPRAGRDEERGRKMPGVGKGQGQGTGEAEREAPRLPRGPASRTAPPPRALCPPAAPSPLSEGRGPAPRLGLAPGAVPAPQGTSGGSLARTSLPRVVAAPTELPSASRRGWREKHQQRMSMCCVHRAIPACKAAAYVALSIESRCELLYVYLMFATGEEHVRLVTMAQLIEAARQKHSMSTPAFSCIIYNFITSIQEWTHTIGDIRTIQNQNTGLKVDLSS